MESALVEALRLEYHPVVLILGDEAPPGAVHPRSAVHGCVMPLFVRAARGETVVLDRESVPCGSGLVALGFTDVFEHVSGGEDGLCRFLSEVECYLKTPELARLFLESLPTVKLNHRYAVFKPLRDLEEGETPSSVILLADPDQLSALVVLANYARETPDNVIVPMGAGCHQIGIYVFREVERERPRAVAGLTDISARLFVDRKVSDRFFTFSAPWSLFLELEGNVAGSFLEKPTWLKLVRRRRKRR
jgi:hypothetical protein